jgi:hypothetical protein
MRKEIREAIERIGDIGGGIYLFSISFLSYYMVMVLKNLAGYSQPLPIEYLTIFIFILPINIPLYTNTDLLAISLIILYTLFAIYDIIRKIDNRRPIVEMFLLSSMIFTISVGIEYIQDLIGVKTGYPKASNDYLYFVSAIVAPFTEEIGFRLTVIGLASIIIYKLIPTLEKKKIKDYLKAFFHPCSIFSENYVAMKMLYWIVIITSIFFGFAHLIGGWGIGKVTLAIIAGLLLGYLFVKYGFTTSVLAHAYFNIYLLALYFLYTLGDKGELGIYSPLALYLGQAVYIFFSLILGAIVGIYYLYLWIDRKYII